LPIVPPWPIFDQNVSNIIDAPFSAQIHNLKMQTLLLLIINKKNSQCHNKWIRLNVSSIQHELNLWIVIPGKIKYAFYPD
jgi:hypothetical protein